MNRALPGKGIGDFKRLDEESYDPQTDGAIFKNYGTDTLLQKKENKRGLQEMLNLPKDDDAPLLAVVSRLVSHKGMD